jgi:single-strand DNA-binding protein
MEETCIGRFNWPQMKFISHYKRKITSTEWHNLVVRNKAAEICENICQRDKIYEGRIKSRQWQTEDGTTKHT